MTRSDISFFQFLHGMIRGPRGERHVGQGWIAAIGRGHERPVGHEYIRRIPYLVEGIEHGCLRVPSHPGRTHLVDAPARERIVATALDVLYAGDRQHLDRIGLHVLAHFQLVFLQLAIDGQYVETPFVLFRFVQRNLVLMVRQDLAERADVHHPWSRLCERLLVFFADAVFGHLVVIAFTAPAALVTETADIIALVAADITEAGDIDPVRATAEIIFILVSFDQATSPNA